MDLRRAIDGTPGEATSAPVVTVLGLGEAGGRLAADLVAAGAEVRAYDPAAAPTPEGVVRFPDPLSAVTGESVVLSLTAASSARAAAESVLPGLLPGALYADLNTASPGLKRELAAVVERAGGRFAHVARLGPVPARGLGAPALASGPGARAFAALFEPLGMPVEVVSERTGDAAAMKLVRSVFMKGLAASAIESLEAARVSGHAEWLEDEIAAVIGAPMLERLLEGSRKHAARRIDEMEAARDLLLELGIEPRIAAAGAAQLAELAAAGSLQGGR